MRVDLDKKLDKDVSNTIKIAIGYPPKLALGKISYVYEKIDNCGQIGPLFEINLK